MAYVKLTDNGCVDVKTTRVLVQEKTEKQRFSLFLLVGLGLLFLSVQVIEERMHQLGNQAVDKAFYWFLHEPF